MILHSHSCFVGCKYLLYITPAFCSGYVNTYLWPLTVLVTPCFAHVHQGVLIAHTEECPFTVNLCGFVIFNQPKEGIGIFRKCLEWLENEIRVETYSVESLRSLNIVFTTLLPTIKVIENIGTDWEQTGKISECLAKGITKETRHFFWN